MLGQGDLFNVSQWSPYEYEDKYGSSSLPGAVDAIGALHNWAEENSSSGVEGQTQLIIVPGYKFRVVDALITNFHLPRSTLLMLTSAFLDSRSDLFRAYNEASEKGYRFLSYGDSSILAQIGRAHV